MAEELLVKRLSKTCEVIQDLLHSLLRFPTLIIDAMDFVANL